MVETLELMPSNLTPLRGGVAGSFVKNRCVLLSSIGWGVQTGLAAGCGLLAISFCGRKGKER